MDLYTEVSLYSATQTTITPHTDKMSYLALASEQANSSVRKDQEGYSNAVDSVVKGILPEHLT